MHTVFIEGATVTRDNPGKVLLEVLIDHAFVLLVEQVQRKVAWTCFLAVAAVDATACQVKRPCHQGMEGPGGRICAIVKRGGLLVDAALGAITQRA